MADYALSSEGHSHFLVIKQHAVHFIDGASGSLLGLKMNEAVTLWPIFISDNLKANSNYQLTIENEVKVKRWPRAYPGH